MTRAHTLLLTLAAVLPGANVVACDLRVTILPHTDHLVFGDPLYLEITLTNQGDEPIAGPPPDLMFGTLAFTICDEQAQLCYKTAPGGGMVGGMVMQVFEPRTSVKYYCTLMLPRYRRINHLFWNRYRDGGEVSVQAVYRPRPGGGMVDNPSKDAPAVASPGGQIVSDRHRIWLGRRPKWQIDRLRFWAEREITGRYQKGPDLADFHLPLRAANREEMSKFAIDAKLDGELGDLVSLSVTFRDIYELPPESREPANRELVEWLRAEPQWKRADEFYMIPRPAGGLERVRLRPEVKRQALARMLRDTAMNYNILSTAKVMEELIEESAASGTETGPEDSVD